MNCVHLPAPGSPFVLHSLQTPRDDTFYGAEDIADLRPRHPRTLTPLGWGAVLTRRGAWRPFAFRAEVLCRALERADRPARDTAGA